MTSAKEPTFSDFVAFIQTCSRIQPKVKKRKVPSDEEEVPKVLQYFTEFAKKLYETKIPGLGKALFRLLFPELDVHRA